MIIMDTQGATLELNGQVYPLESATYHQNGPYTQTLGNGMIVAYQGGDAWIMARMRGEDALAIVDDFLSPAMCVVHQPGVSFTGHAYAVGWSKSDKQVDLRIDELRELRTIPKEIASPPAASVPEQEIAWHELRSACHRKAWREAWEIVGTDHTGGATPGEVYIFGVARQVRAVTAALKAWRDLDRGARLIYDSDDDAARWQRIKQVAAWESQAAAQYVKRAPQAPRAVDARITVGDREITGYRGTMFAADMHVDDSIPNPISLSPITMSAVLSDEGRAYFEDLNRRVRAASGRASRISFGSDDTELYGDGRGIAGVLNYPFTQGSRIVPQPSDLASDKIYMSREQYTALGGEALDRRTPTKPKPRKKDRRSARHTQRRK